MAPTNRERVGAALDLLKDGLAPYVEREMKAVYGSQWLSEAAYAINREIPSISGADPHLDCTALLAIMWARWNEVFRQKLGQSDRSIISELRDTRNKWAHQENFSSDDTYRALDSIERLLTAVSAPEAAEIQRRKQEVLRLRFDEQTRNVRRRESEKPIEGKPAGNLPPWREVVTPHPDVASGHYLQAEFAADLSQVYRGEAGPEYGNPRDFFQRTFITDGLRRLLIDALKRLDGVAGGEPVVKLQTNFGGGKTHSMLALYHLFSGVPGTSLPGIESVLKDASVPQPSQANRAVLVGTALAPDIPRPKEDGIVVKTLWGEMAYQLLGAKGFAMVAEADHSGTSPGSDVLCELFRQAEPSLILIDEWVAFVRQLYGIDGLAAGSFDANLTFAQALTEAARAVPGTLVVATLPESNIEIGGDAGQQALARLENTFARVEAVWRPASAEESFEIARRRLFQPIDDPNLFLSRDATVRAYVELYRAQPSDYPSECRETDYERRMRAAYPIHPELFDRLYEDWSSLERFQRTRGVLRLMAKVIHALWTRDDRNPLILPSTVPIDDPQVQSELTRYLDDNWSPIIERDIDGPNALPLELDKENPHLGRYSACRRVARTIYLGSAPLAGAANRGLDERHVKLGCVQPGESVAIFGDALRRLTDRATFLYVDGQRYWYSTQPTVTRLAQDRAYQQSKDNVLEEIARRLRAQQSRRGEFARVHAAPSSSSDIADESDARLVILDPEHPHIARMEDSPARKFAADALDNRGNSPRRCRNTLVFLAPDQTRLEELEQAVRLYLAWKSIDEEQEALNLDAFQRSQAISKRQDADRTVDQRIPEAYSWLLVPYLPTKDAREVVWEEIRVQGEGDLAVKSSRKLRNEEQLITELGGPRLRLELDRIPLWRGDHVEVRQLMDDFAQYLYLPRLKDPELIFNAIRDGVMRTTIESDGLAYADSFDDGEKRYSGLCVAEYPTVNPSGLVVKPDVAIRQRIAEEELRRREQEALRSGDGPRTNGNTGETGGDTGYHPGTDGSGRTTVDPGPPPRPVLRRFHGSVELSSLRAGRDAGQIAENVIAHLEGLTGARVRVTLEIEADLPDGAPEQVMRTVSENARTLHFDNFGFEEE